MLDKESKVEIFSLNNIVEICLATFNSQIKIAKELDVQLHKKLKNSETYITGDVSVQLDTEVTTNISHKILKLIKEHM